MSATVKIIRYDRALSIEQIRDSTKFPNYTMAQRQAGLLSVVPQGTS